MPIVLPCNRAHCGFEGVVELTREQAIVFLRFPDKALIGFALLRVNLSRKETQALSLTVRDGLTNYEAAQEMLSSERSVCEWKNKALDKCRAAWTGTKWIEMILAASL